MIFGLSTATFTTVHVLISLIGIVAGFVALGAMVNNTWLPCWNLLFGAHAIRRPVHRSCVLVIFVGLTYLGVRRLRPVAKPLVLACQH